MVLVIKYLQHPPTEKGKIYIYLCVCVCVCVYTGRANHTLVSSVLLLIIAFCTPFYQILFILSLPHLHSSYSYLSSVLPLHHIFLHFSSSVLGCVKWPSKGYFVFLLTVRLACLPPRHFSFLFPYWLLLPILSYFLSSSSVYPSTFLYVSFPHRRHRQRIPPKHM